MKHGGIIENSARAVWSLTELGGRVTQEQVAEAYHGYQVKLGELQKKKKEETSREGRESIETDDTAAEETPDSEETWRDELLARLMEMAPDAFERLTQRLLREAGFRNVKVLGRSGDGGIDGVGVYRVSLVSFPTFFQCKRYQGAVQAREVRDFRGALAGRGEKGLLITTGTFTRGAQEEANRDGATPVDLVGGEELCELLKQYQLGVQTRTIEESTVVPDFFEQF